MKKRVQLYIKVKKTMWLIAQNANIDPWFSCVLGSINYLSKKSYGYPQKKS